MLFGLAVSQAVATGVLWFSNHALLARLEAVSRAGFHNLPGLHIDPPLGSLEAAFAGGVFFTLSLGAGLVFLTLGAVSIVRSVRGGVQRLLLWLLAVAAWLVMLAWGNLDGLCLPLAAFLLFVPPAVAWAALRWSPPETEGRPLRLRRAVHFFFILVLLIVWATQLDKDLFVNIKDNLLLSNRPGVGVVRFYYKYTLFPAELLKPHAKRQVNTFLPVWGEGAGMDKEIEGLFLRCNYFPVADAGAADLVAIREGSRLVLARGETPVVVTDIDTFRRSALALLLKFSSATDRSANFRRLTGFTLTWLAPLVVYFAVFAFFSFVPGLFLPLRVSSVIVPLLCCIFLSSVVLFGIRNPAWGKVNGENACRMLAGGSRVQRLAALRYMFENKIDAAGCQGVENLLAKADYAQRYWAIRNLGNSRHPGALPALIRLVGSEEGYLACKAMEAASICVGERGLELLKGVLLNKLKSSDNWYVRHYAYSILRRAGWVPERSG